MSETSIRNAAENSVKEVKNAVVDGYECAKESVQDGFQRVSKEAHDAWDKVSDTSLNDAKTTMKHYVRSNPCTSLLIAAGVGLLVGAVIRGRLG